MFKLNRYQLLIFIVLCLPVLNAFAGIGFGGTRVIYPSGVKEVTLSVKSGKEDQPAFIQSWIETGKKGESAPFVITPPLFLLHPATENLLRIVYVGDGLPQDRESIFWLNTKVIPAVNEKEIENTLVIALKSRFKLFYRPSSLSDQDLAEAYKKLTFVRNKQEIEVTNPTPFYISFAKLQVDGAEVESVRMIAPFETVFFPIPGKKAVNQITWQIINDFGGVMNETKLDLN